MKIKIAHLYYDLLNLYGEQGNITALKNAFLRQGVDPEIHLLTIGDKIDFKAYDLFYIGSGSDENLLLVLEAIQKQKKVIKEVIKKGKYFIATGNSHELFGKYIENNQEKITCLDIFDFYTKKDPHKIIGESFMEFQDLSPIIGFQNRSSLIQNDDNHLFGVLDGYADNFKSSYEGYYEYNFIGTYLIGPLLIRNPHLTDYIVADILKKKKIKYRENNDTYEYQAYYEYLKNFYEQ